jgi:hypothetical protein
MTGGSLKTVSFVGGNISIGDSSKATFGNGDDLQIFHDGSNSIISDEGTGNLILRGSNELLLGTTAGQDILKGTTGGDVKIYHNNSERIATSADGATLTGNLTVTDGHVSSGVAHTYNLFGATGTGGSATYVTYSFNGDGNTGMFSGIADTLRFATGGSERMRITSSGSLLHNTTATSPGQNNTTTGASILAGRFMFNNSGADNIMGRNDAGGLLSIRNGGTQVGLISVASSSTSYATSSDYRLKENVSYEFDATTRLKQLKPSRFNFKTDADTTVDGFLAHEVSSIVPEAINGDKDGTEDITNVVLNADGTVLTQDISEANWEEGKLATTDEDGKTVDPIYASNTTWVASKTIPSYQSIDQSKLVPLLVKSLQEALTEIDTLKTKVAALENA